MRDRRPVEHVDDLELDITEVGQTGHTRRKTVRNEIAELRGGCDVGLRFRG